MAVKNSTLQLAKILAYILGRRPDEYGLVVDADGFVTIKDLLKALGEEKDLRYVRGGHLKEISVALPDAPIEILETRIRATSRTHLPGYAPADNLPKLLYTCVRRKAYPVVLENGVLPGSQPMVVLSSDRTMAERIGRRSDPVPVLLTVSVQQAQEKQVRFLSAGSALYLAEKIPVSCFTGPLPPKVQDTLVSPAVRTVPAVPKQPGSFFPDFLDNRSGGPPEKKDRRGKRPDWKQDRKRMIRMERKKRPWV